MIKKYLIFIFSLILGLTLSLDSAKAESNEANTWLIKSKATGSEEVFAIWMDGRVTCGEPVSESEISNVATCGGNQYISANKWFTNEETSAVRTYWARKPITYAMESTGGQYRIGISAKNYAGGAGWSLPNGYTKFKVDVYIDNKKKGRIFVEASDTELNSGYLVVNNVKTGFREVKFNWKNDSYKPNKKWDANIEINEISFEKLVAEVEVE